MISMTSKSKNFQSKKTITNIIRHFGPNFHVFFNQFDNVHYYYHWEEPKVKEINGVAITVLTMQNFQCNLSCVYGSVFHRACLSSMHPR